MALKRFGSALQTVLGVTSGTVLFLMMAITAVDVAGRYLFNQPLPGGFELTELLLAHHGLLAAGRSVQEAAFLAVFMERMARQQIDAAKVGGSKPIAADEARRARDFLRTDRIMGLTFDAWSRRAERRRSTWR